MSDISRTSAKLTWSGSKGDVKINGATVQTNVGSPLMLTDLVEGKEYVVSVANLSGESNVVKFKTLPEREVLHLEDFSDITDWKLQSSATETSVSIDTVNTLSGQSLKLTTNNGTDIAFVKNSNVDLDLTAYDAFELAVFVEDIRKLENFIFFVGNDVALTNRGTITFRQSNLKAGWNQLTIPFDALVSYGEFDIARAIKAIQLRIKSTDVNGTSVSVDRIDLVKMGEGE